MIGICSVTLSSVGANLKNLLIGRAMIPLLEGEASFVILFNEEYPFCVLLEGLTKHCLWLLFSRMLGRE